MLKHPRIQSLLGVIMKPVVHHFHSHPPHHGARYYAVLATALLVPGELIASRKDKEEWRARMQVICQNVRRQLKARTFANARDLAAMAEVALRGPAWIPRWSAVLSLPILPGTGFC